MVERQKVFVTRNIVPTAILKLREHFDVEVWDDSNPPSKEMLIQKLQNIDGVMTEVSDVIDDEVLASCESLKIGFPTLFKSSAVQLTTGVTLGLNLRLTSFV